MREAIAVADSGPLICLTHINQLELLPRMFSEIIAPPEVWHEVTAKGRGLIEKIKPYLEALIENGIYIRQQLIDAVINDAGE